LLTEELQEINEKDEPGGGLFIVNFTTYRRNHLLRNNERPVFARTIACAVAIATVTLAACFGRDLVGSSSSTGKYTLRTVNDSPLPYTISSSGGAKTEIIRDLIELYPGGTYAEGGNTRITAANGAVTTDTIISTGNWSTFGNSVSLRNNEGRLPTAGTIDGNTMKLTENGRTSVYQK
jgi:hypothetical protein